jgi:hypothetical protein
MLVIAVFQKVQAAAVEPSALVPPEPDISLNVS